MACLIILFIAFLMALPLLFSIFSENTPNHSPPANSDPKPWNIQRSPPAMLTELNSDISALELKLRDLNRLRDIVLEEYEREPNKERQHLMRLLSLDDKIHKTEKELIKLQNKKSLLQ